MFNVWSVTEVCWLIAMRPPGRCRDPGNLATALLPLSSCLISPATPSPAQPAQPSPVQSPAFQAFWWWLGSAAAGGGSRWRMMVRAGRWHAGAAQSVQPVEATAFKIFVAGQNWGEWKKWKKNRANYLMNIFFICRASPPVWVLGPLCTIDTTGGISYSTAYTDIRYEICDGCVVDSAVTVCVVL